MASQNANVEIVVSSKADTRGFKQAETAMDRLNKSVKSLAGGLGIAYGAQAVARFGKDSIKAFVADEEAATKLSVAVKNLGLEFANPYIANYIKQLEATSKVADDQLRPSFQALLQQTGSLAKSQSILNTAIEVSRGSGYDLATVSNDLAQAYIGNTKGLKKYYLGLSAATLKAKSFNDIQDIINKQYSGASAAYLATYSGQVGVLSLAWQNFQEKIGGTLLTLASFGDGTEGHKLNLLAFSLEKIGSAIELIGKGKEAIFGLFDITGKNGLLSKFNPYGTPTSKTKDEIKPLDKYSKLMAQIEADRIKQNKIIIANAKALTAEQKKQAALAKNNALFDMDQIQLVAALKGQLSDEDRTRAELQLAILQGNTAEASKLTAEVAKAQGLTQKLVDYYAGLPAASNPFLGWIETLKQAAILAQQIANSNYGVTAPSYNGAAIDTILGGYGSMPSPAAAGVSATGDVNVYVAGSVVSEGDLVELVRDGLLNRSLSGSPSAIGRLKGSFGS